MSNRSGRALTMDTITVLAGTVVKLVDESFNRDYLLIQNNGTENLIITHKETDTKGLLLKGNSNTYEPAFAPRNEVWIRNDTVTDVEITIMRDY